MVQVNGAAVTPKENPALLALRQHAVDARVMAEQPALPWLYRGLIKRRQAGLITGLWKSGKSMAAIHMSFCRVLQLPLAPAGANGAKEFGSIAGEKRNALYVACERGAGIPGRLKAWQQLHDPGWEKLNASGGKVLYYPRPLNLILEDDAEGLLRFCEENEIDDVTIDTLRSSTAATPTSGDKEVENSQKLMTLLLETSGRLAEKIDGVVKVVHHPKKDDADSTAGAGAIEGSASFKLTVKNDGGVRSLSLAFGNECKTENIRMDFRVQEVAVGVDEEGETLTAGAFVPVAGTYEKSPAKQQIRLLHIMAETLNEKGETSLATIKEACIMRGDKKLADTSRVLLSRLRVDACVEGAGKGAALRITEKGRRAMQITLGERRVPLTPENS